MGVELHDGKYIWDGYCHGNEPTVPLAEFYAPVKYAKRALSAIEDASFSVMATVSFGATFHKDFRICTDEGKALGTIMEFEKLDPEDEKLLSYFIAGAEESIKGWHSARHVKKYIKLLKEKRDEIR